MQQEGGNEKGGFSHARTELGLYLRHLHRIEVGGWRWVLGKESTLSDKLTRLRSCTMLWKSSEDSFGHAKLTITGLWFGSRLYNLPFSVADGIDIAGGHSI